MVKSSRYSLLALALLCGVLFMGGCLTACHSGSNQTESANSTANTTTGWAKSSWQKVMEADKWIRKNMW
jgi:hypothetical protein